MTKKNYIRKISEMVSCAAWVKEFQNFMRELSLNCIKYLRSALHEMDIWLRYFWGEKQGI